MILAVDKQSAYVVIELKVSRGYDRTIGQLLRYMAWVKKNMETPKPVRGFIVANASVTNDRQREFKTGHAFVQSTRWPSRATSTSVTGSPKRRAAANQTSTTKFAISERVPGGIVGEL